jgi:hypothetical protein
MSDEERHLARRAKARSGPVEEYQDPDVDPDGPSEADLERFGGVTINCAGCGTELLDDVQECWKCGRAVGAAKGSHESGLPTWAVLTTVVLVLLVVGWMSGIL